MASCKSLIQSIDISFYGCSSFVSSSPKRGRRTGRYRRIFAVDIESVPFFPGLRIYSVSKEIFPVIRQVDIGKLDTGRVVLPVQGCRDGEVVVIEFLLFCKAE